MSLSDKIIKWYDGNKRNLPWRDTKDPYIIWLSEVILQQTRVDQGLPYFNQFIERFPDVFHLAKGSVELVLKTWQGLGYYSRARNMHYTAKFIAFECKGVFPESSAQLIKLKGVGPYTAAAIASIAFNEVVPVLDGNVYRVMSRYLGIDIPINTPTARKLFTAELKKYISKKNPDLFNQGMMELGALICKPKNPNCQACCLNSNCYAHINGSMNKFPVKRARLKIKNRYFYYFYVKYKNDIYINHRKENDIWKGLYDFPHIEKKASIEMEELMCLSNRKVIFDNISVNITDVSETYIHKLTHRHIYAKFIEVSIDKPLKNNDYKCINYDNINKYPIPKLIDNYLKDRTYS